MSFTYLQELGGGILGGMLNGNIPVGAVEIEEYEDVPYELKFLIYFSKLRKKDYAKLKHFLNT